jgi:Predicted metal-dependent enzyme
MSSRAEMLCFIYIYMVILGNSVSERRITLKNKLMVGGQAVIEGVMMRGPKLVATAVREPSGKSR